MLFLCVILFYYNSLWAICSHYADSTLHHNTFLCVAYTKYTSYKKCLHKFRWTFPDASVTDKNLHHYEKKLNNILYTGQRTYRRHVVNEETVGKTGAALVKSQSKLLAWTAQPTGMSALPASSGASWRNGSTLILLSGEACLHLSEYINSQDNMFPIWIHKVLLYYINKWCAASATMITGTVYFSETQNWHQYVMHINTIPVHAWTDL